MKVKCMEDRLSDMTYGKIYNVEKEHEDGYSVICDDGMRFRWSKRRFEIVEEKSKDQSIKDIISLSDHLYEEEKPEVVEENNNRWNLLEI